MDSQGIVVPDEATKYILFQRTKYIRFPAATAHTLINRVSPWRVPVYNAAVGIEAVVRRSAIKRQYADTMREEYQSIAPYLPPSCQTLLDIGCGVAGIDAYIHRHYKNPTMNVLLLDKSTVESDIHYQYESSGSFYNSLSVAKRLLTQNDVPTALVKTIEANERNEIPVSPPIDVVVSLISWGYHYPVETYLDRVHGLLSDNGALIMDIRKNTNGIDLLRAKFSKVEIILDHPKRQRVLVQR